MNMHDKKYITIGTVPLVGMVGQATPSAPLQDNVGNGDPAQYSPSQPAVLPVGPAQPNVSTAK